MLKIKPHDASRLSVNELLLYLSSISNQRSYSKTTEKIKPVKLAYSSYESTDVEITNNSQKCPAIIMHGLLGSKNNWNSLSKSIHSRTQHKIIAVDARNHGDSPQTPDFNYSALVEDIRYLMNDLNIPKINAIGHSLGGRTMMLLALKYDVYVRQFLLTNLVEIEGGQYKWRVNLEALVNNFTSIVQFKPPNTKFKGPVLFIGGRKSTFLREEDHKGILQLFPEAEFKYIDGAGHWVHSEKPAEFLDLVCDFISKV